MYRQEVNILHARSVLFFRGLTRVILLAGTALCLKATAAKAAAAGAPSTTAAGTKAPATQSMPASLAKRQEVAEENNSANAEALLNSLVSNTSQLKEMKKQYKMKAGGGGAGKAMQRRRTGESLASDFIFPLIGKCYQRVSHSVSLCQLKDKKIISHHLKFMINVSSS